ncbi:hypothetical protein QUB77_02365 [Microcoleus sp. AT9b-C3]
MKSERAYHTLIQQRPFFIFLILQSAFLSAECGLKGRRKKSRADLADMEAVLQILSYLEESD